MGKSNFRKNNKKNKSSRFSNLNKRKKVKEKQPVNKKSLFNRYKNKQKVDEVVAKRQQIEKKLKLQQVNYSESEEEDTYGQLVSCFTNAVTESYVAEREESEMDEENSSFDKSKERQETSIDADHDLNSDQDLDEECDNDLENDSVSNDQFTKHLEFDLSNELFVSMSDSPSTENMIKLWPTLGHLSITIPQPVESAAKKVKSKLSLLEDKQYANRGSPPVSFTNVDFNQLCIKSQIHGNIVSANKTNLIKRELDLNDVFTNLQKELFAVMNNYQDLCYPERTFSNADEIRFIYCLHTVNHMLKTRTKIIHHNAKLNKKTQISDEYRDQGLVRPKVLILLPFKDAAYRVVKTIIDILVPKEAGQVVNKNRFEEDFTGGELAMPRKNPKPEDYELLFAGNTDDTFRLGMTLTKKTLKLYTDFYSSDILVASPLGLRMILGAEGDEDRDYDFLASIEILIMDQADVFLMQNWDHLLHVFDHLHLQPKKTHGTDFSRVRSWAVNGWSKYYRQTLMFSSVLLPEIKSVMNKKCQNYAGKVVVTNPIEIGSIRQVLLQVPQVFHRFNAKDPLSAVEDRLQYFIKEVLPKQRDTLMAQTLIYVPSYFDYVKIRNYFKKEDIGFVQICEYSKDAKIARARDMFFHAEAHFLLYSERVHFFRRFRVKGIRHIIFYQPPTYPHFYSEMCNLMQEFNQNKYSGSEFNMSVTVMYCKYDLLQLAGVLGTERVAAMASSDKPVHMYVTGE